MFMKVACKISRLYSFLVLLSASVFSCSCPANVSLGIAIPDLNFQSRDSGLSNSQSRDPVGIGVV